MRTMQTVHPLRAFRLSQDPPLSQAELANLLGVGRPTVFRWESGARRIDDSKVAHVSSVTGIPKAELRPDLAELMGANQ